MRFVSGITAGRIASFESSFSFQVQVDSFLISSTFDAWRGLVMSFFCVYLYPSSTSTCRFRRPKAARSGPTSIFSMVSKGDTSFTKIGFDIKSSQ